MANDETLFSTNWNDIKFFLMLRRQGRLTAVAKSLGTSHVTVANRISALERSLGMKLFVQDVRGYRLTKAGKAFAGYAEELERQLALALEGVETDRRARPRVRVGVTEGLGDHYLSTRIACWMVGRGLDVDFISLPKMTSVTSREADISITLEKPEGEFVIRRVLTDYTLSIYASGDYLERNGPIESRDELVRHRWIGYIEKMMFTDELRYHNEVSPRLDFVFRSTSIRAQYQAARSGLGLSILPDYMAVDDPALERVMPEMRFERHYWLSTNRDLHHFRAVSQVWDFIRSCCQKDQALLYQQDGMSGS